MEKVKKGVRLENISKIYQDPKTGKDFYAVHDANINIEEMVNKSRGEIAYSVFDLNEHPSDEVMAKIAAAEGVRKARCIR